MRVFAIGATMLGSLVALYMLSPDAGIAALVCGFGYVVIRRASYGLLIEP
jgi:hypothetical protein